MQILFTGATSFAGFWFVGRLATAGHKVLAPLRHARAAYRGVHAERLHWLESWAEVVFESPFGGPALLDLAGARDIDVLCLHDAEADEDEDPAAQIAAGALNLGELLTRLAARGLRAVVATGSLDEPREGQGPASPPDALARAFTYETARWCGEALGVPVSKFVVSRPFGPFEGPGAIADALRLWAQGLPVEAPATEDVGDFIHVDLLGLAYADFVAAVGQGGAARRLAPCGYLESRGAFIERLARELAPRLGMTGRVVRTAHGPPGERRVRVNPDVVDGAALGWRENVAWDALAGYYRRLGFGGEAAGPEAGSAQAVEPMLHGAVDAVSLTQVEGWLTDAEGANPRHVRVVVDGEERGSTRADLSRRDLAEKKISDGASGFRFTFGRLLDLYRDHLVVVQDRDSGLDFAPPFTLRSLVGGPDSVFPVDRDVATVNVASARYEGDAVEVYLDAFGPAARFRTPECAQAQVETLERAAFTQPYYKATGLEAVRLRLSLRPRDRDAPLRIGFAEAAALPPAERIMCENLVPAQAPAYLAPLERENMERVSGPGETVGRFAAGGLATAERIDRLVRLHFGRGLATFGRCLDWGAGPGRVALPMTRTVAPGLEMAAADVDGFNVAYGRAHNAGIAYVEAPFLPPLPFAEGAFGAIYGVSVLTHLSEGAQFAWLAELRRLVARGAPVVLTAHNDYAALTAAEGRPDVLTQLLARGFSDWVADGNLGVKLAQKGYYRASFHTRAYIAENWTAHFELVAIHPRANGSTQDFVVMRAR